MEIDTKSAAMWQRPAEALNSEGVKELHRLQAENAKLRDELDFERSENGWVREFLDRMAEHCGTNDCPSLVAYVEQLEAENAKLRELVTRIWCTARLMDANEHIDGMRITDEFRASCVAAFAELGVEVV